MKKSLIFAIIAGTIITCGAFAVDDPVSGDKRTTSQPYVYNRIQEETQIKIPAANPSNTNIGERVVTYTNVEGGGVIGERELFTGADDYDASTDADKLITAAALNNTFTNLPTTDTTKLECANPADGCTLWTITDQTAYGISGNGTTTIDLASIMGMSQGTDRAYRDNDMRNSSNASTYGLMQDGIWVVDYGNGKRIRGKAQCNSQEGDNNDHTWTNPTISSTLPDASGDYCYCQLDGYTTNGDNWGNMTALSAPWVFYEDEAGYCADYCAHYCADSLRDAFAFQLAFRVAMFNSVQ